MAMEQRSLDRLVDAASLCTICAVPALVQVRNSVELIERQLQFDDNVRIEAHALFGAQRQLTPVMRCKGRALGHQIGVPPVQADRLPAINPG